jgi:hypothetical protein
MISAFEGNKAETKTMLPVIEKVMAAHQLPDANQRAIEAVGLLFILGMKIPDIPCQVSRRGKHPATRPSRSASRANRASSVTVGVATAGY